MSCVILITREKVYQIVEWIPVQMEPYTKENAEKTKKN